MFVCAIGIGIFLHTKNKILGWSCFGLAIEEETFSDGHIISDEVYDAIDKMKLWAYYCEYTKKDHRSNQYLPKYAIYIIGEPTE